MDTDTLRLFVPLLDEANAIKFGHIILQVSVRNGHLYGVEIIETRKKWTLQDVTKRESLIE